MQDVAQETLTEDSISTEAIDFEDSSFVEKNKYASNKTAEDKKEDVDDIEQQEEVDTRTDEERYKELMDEISEQPFELAVSNLEVDEEDVIKAAREVLSPLGYFEKSYKLPFGSTFTLRSKTINDFTDYLEYVRRLMVDPITEKQYETLTQIRNLSYALVEIDGDDLSEMEIEDKFQFLYAMSDAKITMIIQQSVDFWRISHLLLHPGLTDFLLEQPQQ